MPLNTWTDEQWDCVHFRDDSKFKLFGCDWRRFVRRSSKEGYSPLCTKSSVKFGGGSVMMFGMISAAGTGHTLHSKINATVYKEILKKHVVPNLRTAINQPAVFMQDNARVTQRSLLRHFFLRRMLLLWSGQLKANYMNPIENVWKLQNERTKEKNPRNVEGLWTNLKGEWEKISVDECKTSIRWYSKRYRAGIESKVYISSINELWTLFVFRYDVSIIIIIIIISCWQHGYPWPCLATPPYRSSP